MALFPPHIELPLDDGCSGQEFGSFLDGEQGKGAHLLASVTCAGAKQKIAGHKYQKTAAGGDFTPLTDSPPQLFPTLCCPVPAQKAL